MSGPIGLHGGGEYLAGDEPFLDALLLAAAEPPPNAARGPARPRRPLTLRTSRVICSRRPATARRGPQPDDPGRSPADRGVPGLPDRAAATGVGAFERRAAKLHLSAHVEVARVVDAASAAERDLVERIAGADLVHLPAETRI
jgi:hypothetical protein